jgi:hypothetical protein
MTIILQSYTLVTYFWPTVSSCEEKTLFSPHFLVDWDIRKLAQVDPSSAALKDRLAQESHPGAKHLQVALLHKLAVAFPRKSV